MSSRWFDVLKLSGVVASTGNSGVSALFNNKTGGYSRKPSKKKYTGEIVIIHDEENKADVKKEQLLQIFSHKQDKNRAVGGSRVVLTDIDIEPDGRVRYEYVDLKGGRMGSEKMQMLEDNFLSIYEPVGERAEEGTRLDVHDSTNVKIPKGMKYPTGQFSPPDDSAVRDSKWMRSLRERMRD